MGKLKESDIQKAYFDWVRIKSNQDERYKAIFHVPNGGYRGKREAARFKREGVVPGIPDITIPLETPFIELKRPGGRLSKNQKEVIRILKLLGCPVLVTSDLNDAIRFTEEIIAG